MSKEREAWEKKRALEIVKKEERELAEKRTEAEQDWKKKIERLEKSELIASPFLYTDPSTGLMWPRNGNIAEKSMKWNKAMEWVIKLEYAGYSDWRIPTKTEFNSVANYILKDDVVFNEQVNWKGYLSSTNYKNNSDLFWTFNLKSGAWQAIGPISEGYLWPVRGGNVTGERK